MKLLAALVLALPCVLLQGLAGQATQDSPTVISGGGLAHAVRLAGVDEAAIVLQSGRMPVFDAPPQVTGPAFTVESPYWPEAIVPEEDEHTPVEATALYYPQGGYVRVRQGSRDLWSVVDLRRRAVLDRYIRLAGAGLLTEAPASLQVLSAAAASETISIEIAGVLLDEARSQAFWRSLVGVQPRLVTGAQAPRGTRTGIWLVLGLPEARTLQYLYEPSNSTLIDSRGGELYELPAGWLASLLGADTPRPGAALQIDRQPGAGSALWWPLMIGIGLAGLGLAVWTRRLLQARG